MSKVRNTDLLGPTQLRWLEEARGLQAGLRASELNDEKYIWIARCIEALSLLKRRDDEIADLPVLCKQLFEPDAEAANRSGEKGRHVGGIPQVAELAGLQTEYGATP